MPELNIVFFPKQHCSVVFFMLFSLIDTIRWHNLLRTHFDGQLRRSMTEGLYYYIVDKAQGPKFRAFCARTKHSFLSKIRWHKLITNSF